MLIGVGELVSKSFARTRKSPGSKTIQKTPLKSNISDKFHCPIQPRCCLELVSFVQLDLDITVIIALLIV